MFLVYLLLVIMGLVITNFIVTYLLYSSLEGEMNKEIDRLKVMMSDISAINISRYETLKSDLYSLETRCKKVVGRGKKKQTPFTPEGVKDDKNSKK